MALFEKKKRVIEVGGQKIELEPKPGKSPLSFLNKKGKPAPAQAKEVSTQTSTRPQFQAPPKAPQQPAEPVNKIDADYGRQAPQKNPPASPGGMFARGISRQPIQLNVKKQETARLEFPKAFVETTKAPEEEEIAATKLAGKPGPLNKYLVKQISKQKGLPAALREQGIKTDVYSFAKRMFFASIALSAVLGIAAFVILNSIGLGFEEAVILGIVMGLAIFQTAFRTRARTKLPHCDK